MSFEDYLQIALPLFFWGILSSFSTALKTLGKGVSKEAFQQSRHLFFFAPLSKLLFEKNQSRPLSCAIYLAKIGILVLYGRALALPSPTWIAAAVLLFCLLELFCYLIAKKYPLPLFKITALPISCLFCLLLPLLIPIYFLLLKGEPQKEETLHQKLLEFLKESSPSAVDPAEHKLLLSVTLFKERIAREIMIPRIRLVSLSEEATLSQAAKLFVQEGYSRIPIYQETVDHITGVLLYKDLLAAYTLEEKLRPTSIKSFVKPILYAPETKKISALLQEFRARQIHLAIVVDEYGGTEGLITIEDILEELVGEIADEHDTAAQSLYSKLASGGWLVDAKMTIIDMEKELGIHMQASPEYDTLGGYIFHRAGAIPERGWRIHHDNFDLEVISSEDRSIGKVKITPKQI